MPSIIPVANSLIDETDSAVKLARYAQIIGLEENGFFGLNAPDINTDNCHPIWTLVERVRIARYLAEAQEEIEQVTGYPLTPRWIEEEQQYYSFSVHARWTKIIEGGFRNTSVIHAGMSITYTSDPITITHATTVTDTGEIAVMHPGTDIEIYPSSVEISGGTVTIQIPWARLVKESAQDNAATGSSYSVVPPAAGTVYEATVDIVRVYNDDSIQAGLFWTHRESAGCACTCASCCGTCGDYSETACMYIINPETGAIDVLPASWSGATGWTAYCDTCYCALPDRMRLNYRAGMSPMTLRVEEAVISLAHAKMSEPICNCGVAGERWKADNEVVPFTNGKLPFGLSKRGAFRAWDITTKVMTLRGMAIGE
jgi:hypothetical protein